MGNCEIITKDEYNEIADKYMSQESIHCIVKGMAFICSMGFGTFLGALIKGGIPFYSAGFFILGPLIFNVIKHPLRFLLEKYYN